MILADDWHTLTTQGGVALERLLGGGSLLPHEIWEPLNYYTAHACLAGIDSMWGCIPVAWRNAAATVPLDHLPPVQVQQDVVAVILDSMIWRPPLPGGPGRKTEGIPLLVGGTVKQATTFLSLHVQDQRQAAWLEFVSAAQATQPAQPQDIVLPEHLYDEPQQQQGRESSIQQPQLQQQQQQHALHHLTPVVKEVWHLPWHNCHKEVLWRLAVHGVPWAGGHDIVPAQPCSCGWQAPDPSNTHLASLAWREHCFWSCPVAQQVVDQLRRALPPTVTVSRAHVWLLLSPNGIVVRPDVWMVVGLAALSAMLLGRRVLHANLSAAAQQPQQSSDHLRQATLEEVLGVASLASQDGPAGPDYVQQAGVRAAAEFWALLQDFACMHDGYFQGPWWEQGKRSSLPLAHPFLAGCGVPGSVKVLVPPTNRLDGVG
jgi:hypothetical protein